MLVTHYFNYNVDFIEDIHGKRDTIILQFSGLEGINSITIKYAETDLFTEYQFLNFLGHLGADLAFRYDAFNYLMSFAYGDDSNYEDDTLEDFIANLNGYTEYNAPISVNRFLGLKEVI